MARQAPLTTFPLQTMTTDIGQQFIDRSRSFLDDEYRTKIRRAVEALPQEVIWWRPHEHSNAVGNLLLHLAGNARQWIVAGVGQTTDIRDRASEFSASEGMDATELLAQLDVVLDDAVAVLARLRPADLATRLHVQTRDVSVMDAIYQVVQHFALHLGQIILIAKERAPGAVRFYEDAGGAARPIWQEQRVKR